MRKIALHGDLHTCPQPGHQEGPIVVQDFKRPTINGIPIATVGDKCQCRDGSLDTIITGSSLFTINGIPAAITGSQTEHGGIIIEGHASLTIE